MLVVLQEMVSGGTAGGGIGGTGLVTKSIFSIRALLNTISLKDSTLVSSGRSKGSPGKWALLSEDSPLHSGFADLITPIGIGYCTIEGSGHSLSFGHA